MFVIDPYALCNLYEIVQNIFQQMSAILFTVLHQNWNQEHL